MVQVTELLNLTLFDEFELIAGEEGLTNQLGNIVILEYESISDNYQVFSPGDLILTSLFFAKDDPSLIYNALYSLMQKGVAAIAIKTVFFKDIDPGIKEQANRMRIPLFTFEYTYMEDLIISGNELLKSKLQYLVFEEKISKLIDTTPANYTVKTIAHEINPAFYSQIICAYLTPKGTSGFSAISSYFQRLLYKRYQTTKAEHYSYIKYHQGMILIFSFEETIPDVKDVLFDQLKKIDLNQALFHIGITDSPAPLERLDRSVSQSIYSNRYCQLNNSHYEFYSNLGVYQFIIPLLYTPSLLEIYEKSIQILKVYDEKYTSNLLDTLIIYINCNGRISATAEKIFQHPNTVRYRLQKIAALLECPENDFYQFCFILVKIYLIKTHSTI